jgi:hypothetical protein
LVRLGLGLGLGKGLGFRRCPVGGIHPKSSTCVWHRFSVDWWQQILDFNNVLRLETWET